MTEQKARTLASALAGDAVRTMSSWGVAMTRADGRYVLIKESGGLIWFHEHRCWHGCQVNGSGCKGDIRGVRWKEWGINKKWATGLARLR
jgi:hypothetical protein